MSRYALSLGLLGLAQMALVFVYGGVAAFLFGWSSISFLLASSAYAGIGPRVFGKRADGTLTPLNALLCLPYLLLTWAAWFLKTHIGNHEALWHEVAPGLYLGRRLARPQELPEGVTLIVDLTAELPEPRSLREQGDYQALPIVDYTAPTEAELRAVVKTIQEHSGGVYIHCALGHGRSALVAGAVLIARNQAKDAAEAESLLRQVRSEVRLNTAQRQALKQFARLYSDHTASSFPEGSAK